MNVTIKTMFGEMSFDLQEDFAMALVRSAMKHDRRNQASDECEKEDPVVEIKEEITQPVEPDANEPSEQPAEPKPKEAPKSRVEAMFGDRATWATPAAKQAPERKSEPSNTARGFLYVKCDLCGSEKGFCTKTEITDNRCNICGNRTFLRDLIPMHVHCKCGAEFKYRTNMRVHGFTYSCLRCGSPIDMVLNSRETAYVTLESIKR